MGGSGAKRRGTTSGGIGKWLVLIALLGFVALSLVEVGLRFFLGLGDPPALQADPEIQYYFVPDRTYHRFGNAISYNSWSMRSGPLPAKKAAPDEFRILVLGDSVINGGAPTDQSELATELLRARAEKARRGAVRVGNVSAGSWGPENLLAYVKRFGTFEADVAMVVLSSHDAGDVIDGPGDLPRLYRGPLRATAELVDVYVPRLLGRMRDAASAPVAKEVTLSPQDVEVSMTALRELLHRLKQKVSHVAVVLHHERDELDGPVPGLQLIAQSARRAGVPVVDLGPREAQAVRGGIPIYRDNVHPTAEGQKLLADAFFDYVAAISRPP